MANSPGFEKFKSELVKSADFALTEYEDVAVRTAFAEKLGYKCHPVESSNHSASVYEGKDDIIVCFRGTNDFKDVIIDASAFKVKRSIGRMHNGFVDSWETLKHDIYEILEKINPDKSRWIRVSGHSLGAAMATIASAYLHRKNYIIKRSFVFGSPNVGDKTWYEGFKARNIELLNIINSQDIVTKVPWLFYKKVGEVDFFSPNPKKNSFLHKRPFTWNIFKRLWGGGKDHSMVGYAAKAKLLEEALIKKK